MNKNKIAIIGAGSVGATIAYNISNRGLANEIVLVDLNAEKAEAEVLDITHGMPLGNTTDIYAAGYEGCADAELVIITAGAKQRPEESRPELMDRNVGIMKSMVRSIMESGFRGVILVVTNPVDVLTYVAYRESGLPYRQVIGSGTVLDSARLRTFLSRQCSVNPQNIHAYVIGEHGDTAFPAWSNITFGGIRAGDYCAICRQGCDDGDLKEAATEYVRRAAQKIIQAKGSTFYAVAQAVAIITQAVLRDERRILPVTGIAKDFDGFRETAFSYPRIIGKEGVMKELTYNLTDEEQDLLHAGIEFISGNIEKAGY
ncbi:MAG: L-lactate dehydrogenase [Alkalispirochaetaceae bacterium]